VQQIDQNVSACDAGRLCVFHQHQICYGVARVVFLFAKDISAFRNAGKYMPKDSRITDGVNDERECPKCLYRSYLTACCSTDFVLSLFTMKLPACFRFTNIFRETQLSAAEGNGCV
jgi:hypothetical protein